MSSISKNILCLAQSGTRTLEVIGRVQNIEKLLHNSLKNLVLLGFFSEKLKNQKVGRRINSMVRTGIVFMKKTSRGILLRDQRVPFSM